jgi:predicted transcriptional regulator
MVMFKESILKALDRNLPEDAGLADAIELLEFFAGIEAGLADIEAGRVISHEEMVERTKSWRSE